MSRWVNFVIVVPQPSFVKALLRNADVGLTSRERRVTLFTFPDLGRTK